MKKFFLSLALALSVFSPLLVPSTAHAVDVRKQFKETAKTSGLIKTDQIPKIQDVLGQIIFSILSLVGVLILILIIYAGFQWATARGNDTQVQTAQKTLVRAVIGLIIVFASFALTTFVLSSLSGAVNTAPSSDGTAEEVVKSAEGE